MLVVCIIHTLATVVSITPDVPAADPAIVMSSAETISIRWVLVRVLPASTTTVALLAVKATPGWG